MNNKRSRQRVGNRPSMPANDPVLHAADVPSGGQCNSKRRPFVFRRTAPFRGHHSDADLVAPTGQSQQCSTSVAAVPEDFSYKPHSHHSTNESALSAADLVKRALKVEVSKRLHEPIDPPVDTSVNVCILTCEGNLADVSYVPCGHRLICSRCAVSARPKRCQVCHRTIKSARDILGKPASLGSLNNGGDGRGSAELELLRGQLEQLEISTQCPICMEGDANTVFQCGHRACFECSEPLENCHMCRVNITSRQRIFLG